MIFCSDQGGLKVRPRQPHCILGIAILYSTQIYAKKRVLIHALTDTTGYTDSESNTISDIPTLLFNESQSI
jgi:hypothetical protein